MKELMKPFAESILPIVKAFHHHCGDKRKERVFKAAIKEILQKAGDFHPSGVNVAAQKKFQMNYPNQNEQTRIQLQPCHFIYSPILN